MWSSLTPESGSILESLAKECSRDGEEAATLKVFMDGFLRYGKEAVEVLAKSDPFYASCPWEDFYRDRYRLLLENIGFAGRTYEQAFLSIDGRSQLCQLVRSTGVKRAEDVEDIVQELSGKWWRAKYAEKYNPLISSWRTFLLVAIKRYVISYRKRKSTRVTPGVLSLDMESDEGSYGRTIITGLYDPDQEEIPGGHLIVREVIEDWEDYLRRRKPIRTQVRRDFKKLCTLLPPGVTEIPTTDEKTVFFLKGGVHNSRVTTRELYEVGTSIMVPNEQLVDYISEDPVTRAQLVDAITGEFITQKDFLNPNYDPLVMIKVERALMDFYQLLMQGYQVDEIANKLRMAFPSVRSRIRKLECMFREFWTVSNKIPSESKIRAASTYKCPGCYRLDMVQREACQVCGTDMRAEVAEVRFKEYPWGKVRVTQKTKARLGEESKKERVTLVVQRGSISGRF